MLERIKMDSFFFFLGWSLLLFAPWTLTNQFMQVTLYHWCVGTTAVFFYLFGGTVCLSISGNGPSTLAGECYLAYCAVLITVIVLVKLMAIDLL